MKIGLIDVDSKIPNLALMKISAWHKQQDDEVEFYMPLWNYDKIYASKVFDFTPMPYLPKNCIIGGSGYDLSITLPEEVEYIRPDYNLYKNCNYSIGFITRGCIRKCSFCKVPEKEGIIKFNQHFLEFENPVGKWWIFLDNNILAYTEVSDLLSEIIDRKMIIDFNQGTDIRLLSEDLAEKIVKINWLRFYRFSFDWVSLDTTIIKKVKMLNKLGMKSYKMLCYVLIGYNSTPEEDYYRVMLLRSLGVDIFVMPYNKFDFYQKNFCRWVNHRAIFKSICWKDYNNKFKKSKSKIGDYLL